MYQGDIGGNTALTIAADKGHDKFVELLLKKGAAVNMVNRLGSSPLWLARTAVNDDPAT